MFVGCPSPAPTPVRGKDKGTFTLTMVAKSTPMVRISHWINRSIKYSSKISTIGADFKCERSLKVQNTPADNAYIMYMMQSDIHSKER